MIQTEQYRKEIMNFLETVTIKFNPFADIVKENLLRTHGLAIQDDESHPYYLHLCGMYHETDTKIYVTAVETGETVLFDRELVKNYPKTAAIYRVGNPEYTTLCQTYPDQTDLIKAIVYPVADIKTAIEAKNLTLLGYDDSFLHTNERASLVDALQKFLVMVEDKHYVKEFVYEELYPLTLWAALWYNLPTVLFTQRWLNIKTSSVHPEHIWEYLTSKGLGDYRAILNDNQSLFLYRNIDYLLKNKGKMSNLHILAEHLLKDLYVSLVRKNCQSHTYFTRDTASWIPEILSEEVLSYRQDKDASLDSFESMDSITTHMFSNGLEIDNSAEHVLELEERIGNSPQDFHPTKLLEIRKNTIDTKYEDLLAAFLLDTLMLRFVNKKVSYRVRFVDELSTSVLDLSIGEALALFYYASHKRFTNWDVPHQLPTHFVCTHAYQLTKPNVASIPKHLPVGELHYDINHWVDVAGVLGEIPWDNMVLKNQTEFLDLAARQFRAMVAHTKQCRSTADVLEMRGMARIYDHALYKGLLDVDLIPGMVTYPEWFASSPTLDILCQAYDTAPLSEDEWGTLSDRILEALIPPTHELLKPFVGVFDRTNALYDKLKELFIQLCSYNIAFLDTSRSKNFYIFFTPVGSLMEKWKYNGNTIINVGNYEALLEGIDRMDLTLEKEFDVIYETLYGVVRDELEVDTSYSLNIPSVSKRDVRAEFDFDLTQIDSYGGELVCSDFIPMTPYLEE